MGPGEVTITPPDRLPIDLPPHKFYVAPKGKKGDLTEEQALQIGRDLYDAITKQQAKEARAQD
jgi:hypothetical protein